MPFHFKEEAFSSEEIVIDSEERAKECLNYPDDLCFRCPLYELNVTFGPLCGLLNKIWTFQIAGVQFEFGDFEEDVWLCLGVYKSKMQSYG